MMLVMTNSNDTAPTTNANTLGLVTGLSPDALARWEADLCQTAIRVGMEIPTGSKYYSWAIDNWLNQRKGEA